MGTTFQSHLKVQFQVTLAEHQHPKHTHETRHFPASASKADQSINIGAQNPIKYVENVRSTIVQSILFSIPERAPAHPP
eukprot:128407-Amphidinium_carterae.1